MPSEIRTGLIGFGNWTRKTYAPVLQEMDGVSITAVAARSETSRQAARDMIGDDVRLYADWRELLADDAVDAVMIALPTSMHAGVNIAAVEAGKHVFFEPPAGCDRDGCERVIETLARSDRVVQCDLELRYLPVLGAVNQLLAAGELGNLLMVKVTHWCDWGPGLIDEVGEEGIFLLNSCWYFDALNAVIDDAVKRVQISGGCHLNGQMFDHGYVLLDYANGVTGVYEMSLIAAKDTVIRLHVLAEHGEIEADLKSGQYRHRLRGEDWRDGHAPSAQPVRGFEGMTESIRDFIGAIREGRTPRASIEAIRRAHEAALMCRDAMTG